MLPHLKTTCHHGLHIRCADQCSGNYIICIMKKTNSGLFGNPVRHPVRDVVCSSHKCGRGLSHNKKKKKNLTFAAMELLLIWTFVASKQTEAKV
ncbi:hypothetical protein AGOR_G00174890 [Albula goreensis]|uniref:Uncharacterized protein n=1 Tax=Albula goreensis TaxID=1534307 RepID=A0A8T3CUU5_9TELE|nr:hypothetical protein AGOR_G00174890 [Albula goreensis]